MAIFFFLVGLEIKREFIFGELREPKKAALPIMAALGGMAIPAIIWALFTSGGAGWAIAMPTDIALALGALALLGSRIDTSLKIFLLTLAISDDLFSIIVLGTFYSSSLSFIKIASTIGAVVLAFLIPIRDSKKLDRLIELIHPWSAFLIVPLFALVNIGVVIDLSTLPTTLTSPIALALIIGRPVGKLIGITLFAWLAIKLKIAQIPSSLSFKEIAGAGALAGMGLTVSLFIAELALDDSAALDQVRVGLIIGAIISALLGITILRKYSAAQD
jgi:NhaA family Na+:H+ antiporter